MLYNAYKRIENKAKCFLLTRILARSFISPFVSPVSIQINSNAAVCTMPFTFFRVWIPIFSPTSSSNVALIYTASAILISIN